MRSYFILGLLLSILTLNAQITGTVSGKEGDKTIPLAGANLVWEGTQIGVITDANGHFSIEKPKDKNTLKASFIGYQTASKIIISSKGKTNFVLNPANDQLNTVDVIGKVDATTVDLKRADLTFKIDDKELRKAACCNLSESFETNATVDVSFTDAVTGTKHIEMLGLAGRYALIQRENIPFARGLNASTGFTYIPGPFVESIQLTKGLSSVINGYESLTGQINVEYYKPETAPPLLFNAFANEGGRMEGNLISSFEVAQKTKSAILLHYSNSPFTNDHNNDGFADMPTGSQLNIGNRWQFGHDEKGWEGQVGFNIIEDKRNGGQIAFLDEQNPADSLWGYTSVGRRYELFGKTGYIFNEKPFRSLGLIYNGSYQERNATFGYRSYKGDQKSGYFNSIFQDIIKTTAHKYRTGISLQIDEVKEELSNDNTQAFEYLHSRTEFVPGAYFEYTFEPNDKLTLVTGVRGDYNSYFNKAFVTPRVNFKYTPFSHAKTTFRLGGGRGLRTPNMLIEHLHILAGNRVLDFGNASSTQMEIGWNAGASLSQGFQIGERQFKFTLDGFYSWFENKLIKDSDFSPTHAYFIYAKGSNSLSILGQLDVEIIKDLDLRLAYKYLNSQDNYLNGFNQVYLVPKNRAFANLAYTVNGGWKFDFTLNWFDKKRISFTGNHPVELQTDSYSDDFFLAHLQINKEFKNGLELFTGADNLFNFRQTSNPIMDSSNPSSPYFDTNFTWGPIFGRNIYLGLYYRLDKKEK